MKKLNKFTAVLLCVALMLCAMPVVSANTATNTENLYNSELSQTVEESAEPYIIGELTEKRTENTKHFLMSDRTVTAAVYNKPVHYKDGDTWENIDNSFSETEDSSELQNKSNSVKTKFSKKSNGKKLVTVDKEGFSLSWWLEDADKVDAVASQSNNTTTSDDMSALKNIEGSVTYPEIQENADLQYVLSGSDIKENIILKSQNAPFEYTFTYESKKLKYRTNEQNQIEFYDENDSENTVFIIDTPYMYDSAKAYSADIEMQITETNKGLTLTLVPDKEWLLSEERVYPIVIDPTTLSSQKAKNIWDIEIRNPQTEAFSYTAEDFLVGSNEDGWVYRTLLRFIDLPEIGVGGIVVNAKMNITAYKGPTKATTPVLRTRPTDDIQVNVHRITTNWPEQGAVWNDYANSYNPIVEDYFIYNDTDEGFIVDITKAVSDWYSGEDENYGIMLKAADESAANHVMQFNSSDWGLNDTNSETWRPVLVVNYRSCVGLEDYWSYTTQDMGGYGTGYVNNYNGNLTYIHNDASFNSGITGFTLSHVYNGANANSSTGRYGKGWGLNLVQRFETVVLENNDKVKFVYTDGDGTKHYFVELEDKSIVDEDGLGYTFSSIDEGELIYKLTDKDKNVLKFDEWGALRRIIDTNGNTINLNYSPVPNQFNYLSSITTSSGGVFALKYDSNYVLTSITDNAGRVTNYSYSNGNLTKITYPDGTDLDFTYYSGANGVTGSSSWLHGVTLPNGYQYKYGNYDDGKVYMSTEQAVSETQINKLYYTYSNNQTTVRDLQDRYIKYQFDTFGRVTCAYDKDGNSYSETYTPKSETKAGIFANNKLSVTSSNIKYINNYINNSVFANDLSSWTKYIEAPNETQISVVTDQSYLSPKSAKITSTASSIQALIQYPSTTAGKTYTLSANIKTENVVSATHGAGVEIVTSSSAGNKHYLSDFILGTTNTEINNGFVTVSSTVALASDENIIRISVGLYNASGTVWIDSVQLEEGDTANKINMLSNSSFESGSTAGYTTNFGASTGNGASTAQKQSGSYSCKIAGVSSQTRSIYQKVNISGKAGDVYSVGGWGKAYTVPVTYSNLTKKPNFRMYLNVYNGANIVEAFEIKFNEYVSDWQYVSKAIVLTKDYTALEVYFTYDYNCNTAYFDDMFLYRDTAQSYKYDDDGNVVSTADYAAQQSTFEYSDNNLSKIIEPTGTEYTYKYDNKNNLVNAWSNIGIDYNIVNDATGNATQTIITQSGASEITQYSAVYYIKNKSSGQYLTVSGGVCTRANINQQPLTNAPLQRWRVKKLSNGNYIIRPENCDEHALAFENRTVANTTVLLGVTGTDVETYDWSQWSLIANNDEEHSFKIKTMATNCVTQYISIAASDTTNGGNIYMDYDGSTDNKSWIFMPADEIITSSATYQNNGNYPHTVTDSRGNTTTYTYDTARGLQTGVTDAKGNTTTYSYNSLNDRLDSVTSGSSTVTYNYDSNNILQGITSPSGTVYNFTYDEFGNRTKTEVGSQTLSINTYDTTRGLLTEVYYGNVCTVGYNYNLLDQITEKLYNDVVKVKFRYDKFGNLYEKQDLFTGVTYRYSYDLTGRITGITGSDNTSLNYVYDDYNRVNKFISKVSDNTNITEYIYGDSDVSGQKDGLIYGVKQNDIQRISYSYDELARLNTRTLNTTTKYITKYRYLTDYTTDTTTTLVEAMEVGYDTLCYAYDESGNIIDYAKNGKTIEAYTYDSLNQLKTVTRGTDVYEYTYDNGGNILSVTKNGNATKGFTYSDDEWKDLLTSYNGMEITYDAIGNPRTYYDGTKFYWQYGRRLWGVKTTSGVTKYTYNGDGLRAVKDVDGTVTNYYWSGSMLLGEQTGDNLIIYLYDENSTPYGFIYNGVYYYYAQNAQGDIIAIIDADGNEVVWYEYSTWGEILSITGTLASTIGKINPLRYRGYYYDNETGFYLTGTRYYDPEIGRFINADGEISDVGGNILGYNLFAYCFNNPVNMDDPTGQWPKWLTGALNVVSGVAQMAAGAALGAFTSWTGVGAVAAGFLIVNGAATATQGIGQIVNDVTKTNVLREDNIVRTAVKDVGRAIGGDTGAKIAGGAYDVAAVAANLYAGKVGLQQTGLAPIKVNINKVLNNPMDEFVTCGPAPGVISDYCRSIPLNGYGKIYATQLPNGFYQLANGHHRVAALRSLGKETIKIFLTK